MIVFAKDLWFSWLVRFSPMIRFSHLIYNTFTLIDIASTTIYLSFSTKMKALSILALELQKILRSHRFELFWKNRQKIAIEKSVDISKIMAWFCFNENITLLYLSASILSNLDKKFKSDRCFIVFPIFPNSSVQPKAQYQ